MAYSMSESSGNAENKSERTIGVNDSSSVAALRRFAVSQVWLFDSD
jgi:hypothetical protein